MDWLECVIPVIPAMDWPESRNKDVYYSAPGSGSRGQAAG